jgi:hypothetical protein
MRDAACSEGLDHPRRHPPVDCIPDPVELLFDKTELVVYGAYLVLGHPVNSAHGVLLCCAAGREGPAEDGQPAMRRPPNKKFGSLPRPPDSKTSNSLAAFGFFFEEYIKIELESPKAAKL